MWCFKIQDNMRSHNRNEVILGNKRRFTEEVISTLIFDGWVRISWAKTCKKNIQIERIACANILRQRMASHILRTQKNIVQLVYGDKVQQQTGWSRNAILTIWTLPVPECGISSYWFQYFPSDTDFYSFPFSFFFQVFIQIPGCQHTL